MVEIEVEPAALPSLPQPPLFAGGSAVTTAKQMNSQVRIKG